MPRRVSHNHFTTFIKCPVMLIYLNQNKVFCIIRSGNQIQHQCKTCNTIHVNHPTTNIKLIKTFPPDVTSIRA